MTRSSRLSRGGLHMSSMRGSSRWPARTKPRLSRGPGSAATGGLAIPRDLLMPLSHEVGQFLRRKARLAQDRAESARGKVTVPVYWHDNQGSAVNSPKVVVAAGNVRLLEAGSTQRAQKISPADPWEAGQGAATSISTMSRRCCSSGTGRPSLLAASRYPTTASRVCPSASSRVAPYVERWPRAGT